MLCGRGEEEIVLFFDVDDHHGVEDIVVRVSRNAHHVVFAFDEVPRQGEQDAHLYLAGARCRDRRHLQEPFDAPVALEVEPRAVARDHDEPRFCLDLVEEIVLPHRVSEHHDRACLDLARQVHGRTQDGHDHPALFTGGLFLRRRSAFFQCFYYGVYVNLSFGRQERFTHRVGLEKIGHFGQKLDLLVVVGVFPRNEQHNDVRERAPRGIVLDAAHAAAHDNGELVFYGPARLRQGEALADEGRGRLFAPQDLVADALGLFYVKFFAYGCGKLLERLNLIVACQIDDLRNNQILFKRHEYHPFNRQIYSSTGAEK